jgi:superfamily I DNA/RNA helicase
MPNTSSKSWSVQQQAIFTFARDGRGNLVVRARAGTGKTTTIIEMLGYFASSLKILLCAFNKRIATELEGRISVDNAEAKTLHALGFAFIRRMWSNIKVDANVDFDRVMTVTGGRAPDAMVGLIKKLAGLVKSMHPFAKLDVEADVAQVIEIAEEYDLAPDEEWAEDGWTVRTIAEAAIKAKELARERDASGRISFDDMVFIPLVNNFCKAWYDVVIVDEAQDMNKAQLMLAQRSCKPGGRIIVVGDDRQAIYGFRGADSGSIDRLKTELSATELGLTLTYRCGKEIVRLASQFVPDFEAAETNPQGIVDSISAQEVYNQAKPGDFILSRKNAPLLKICLSFLKAGKACRIEGRDVAEGLRVIVRKLKAKSIPDFVAKLAKWEEKELNRFGNGKIKKYAHKCEAIRDEAEVLAAMAEGCANVVEVTTRLDTLFADSGETVPKNTIVCSSVHKAKGLEADRVFIVKSTLSTKDIEEKNIFYVAVTRAKHHLTWI